MNPTRIQEPLIVKYVHQEPSGIQLRKTGRYGIGYVIQGRKYFYNGDQRREINRGDMFYIPPGLHYVENMPEEDKPFEQIVFYYSSDKLVSILSQLSLTYGLQISNDHYCANCDADSNCIIYPSWSAVRSFFSNTNQYLKEGLITRDETAENIKMTELIYLILSQNDCCFKGKILKNDSDAEVFEQIIHKNIFNPVSIETLAQECNRSPTSFKKEFKAHFMESPHRWFTKQRLRHSQLLLISCSKSISEIGNECKFTNTSHFIKLFKKEYGVTPAVYRDKHNKSLSKMRSELVDPSLRVSSGN